MKSTRDQAYGGSRDLQQLYPFRKEFHISASGALTAPLQRTPTSRRPDD